jgi:hypothetical protein
MENTPPISTTTNATVTIRKSRFIAFLLTFFFGPIGLLYTTVLGALIMTIFGGLFIFLTAGFGAIIIWPLSMIIAVLTAGKRNVKAQITT